MNYTTFCIISAIAIIILFILMLYELDCWMGSSTAKVYFILILVILIANFIIFSDLSQAQSNKNAAKVYDFTLMETWYIDESSGIQLEETLGAGHTLKFVSDKGTSTNLTLAKDHDRYEIIYTEENSKVELYNVTAQYNAWFIWKEKTEEYYKVYVNKDYLSSDFSEN